MCNVFVSEMARLYKAHEYTLTSKQGGGDRSKDAISFRDPVPQDQAYPI